MPDELTNPLLVRKVEMLHKLGAFTGYDRRDVQKLVERGFPRSEAQALINLNNELNARRPEIYPKERHAYSPLPLIGEAFQTLQKPIIAAAAGISHGDAPLTIVGDTLASFATGKRTFGEVFGVGTGGALALDMVVDPIWLLGMFGKTGRAGQVLKVLENARVEVAGSNILKSVPKWVRPAETVGKSNPVTSISEAFLNRSTARLKNRSYEATQRWFNQVDGAYKEFVKQWQKKMPGRTVPSIDDVFVGAGGDPTKRILGQAPSYADLVKHGSESLVNVALPVRKKGAKLLGVPTGVGWTRKAPLRDVQAKIMEKMSKDSRLAKLLNVNREAAFAKAVESAAIASKHVSGMQAKAALEDFGRVQAALGVDPKDYETMDKAVQLMESQGILGAGGQKVVQANRQSTAKNLGTIQQRLLLAIRDARKPTEKTLKSGETRVLKGGVKAREAAQKRIDRLGVLVEENPITGDVVALQVDKAKAPHLDLDKVTRWSKEARFKRFQELVERTVDPVTGKPDARVAVDALRTEIEGSIKGLVTAIYGFKADSAVTKLAQAMEDMFTRLGVAEMTAGTLTSFGKGHFPRETSLFGDWAIQEHLRIVGRKNMPSAGPGARDRLKEFDTYLKHAKQRGFGHLTRMQVEDLFKKGQLEIGGFRPSAQEWGRYLQEIGADKNPGWATFMDMFNGLTGRGKGRRSIDRSFHRKIARTDPRAARFFLSDPLAMGAKRWATGITKMKAQDYTKQVIRAMAITSDAPILQGAKETAGDFFYRVTKEVKDLARGANEHDFQAVIQVRGLPEDVVGRLEALGGQVDHGIMLVPHSLEQQVIRTMEKVPAAAKKRLEAHILTRPQAEAIIGTAKRFEAPDLLQGFMSEMERMTSFWKQWALFPRPAYHFRNFISNNWLMLMAGMMPWEIMEYNLKAARLMAMATGTTRETGLFGAGRLFGRGEITKLRPGELNKAQKIIQKGLLTDADDLSKPFLKTALGDMTGEEVWLDLINTGVFGTEFVAAEVGRSLIQSLDDAGFKATTPWWNYKRMFSLSSRGALQSAGQATARQVEGLSRAALYLWSLERQGMGRSMAASNVFEHLFNYNDLGPGERTLRATIIPFWSWVRNNVPLQIKKMIQRPALTLSPIRAAQSIRNQREISEELEPQWLSEQLGFPVRTYRDKDGRLQAEFGAFGSYFPVADLVDLSKAVTSVLAVGYDKTVASLKESERMKDKREVLEGISAVASHVNPVITAPIEWATGFSFFRMRQIQPTSHGLVEIPFLGGYKTTPLVGQLIAAIPVLKEIDNLLKGQDYRNRDIPIQDRVMRLFTGSPKLLQQGPSDFFGLGGRISTDVTDARMRGIRRQQSEIGRHKRQLKELYRFGKASQTDFDRIMELIKIRQQKARDIAGAKAGGQYR